MNVEQIKKVSKTKYLHHLARLNLQERYQSRLIVTMNGGSWRVTTEIISFLNSMTDQQIVLIDMYENPCKVDRIQLLEQCLTTYREVMMEWYTENEKINQQR